MTKGWRLESARHSLARRGIETKGIEKDPQRMWNVRVAAHADATQKELQPFALKHKDVKEGAGETYQYDVLGQFYGEDRGGEKVGKLYQRYYKGRKAEIVWMTPDEYFEKVNLGIKGKGYEHDIREGLGEKGIKKYADAMRKGDKFAMPWLEYRKGKYDGHEGKHRVAAAKLLGIKKIPVVISNQLTEGEDHRRWMKAKEKYGIKD
jgi:hypothetical protein